MAEQAKTEPQRRITELTRALEKCRDNFREYEGIYTLKLRDYKGKEPLNYAAEMQYNINRNREIADMCDATLTKGDTDHDDR